MAHAVYSLLLTAIHLALGLFEFFLAVSERAWNAAETLVWGRTPRHVTVQADTRRLKKVPRHLALVLEETSLSLDDIAMLLCWSLAAGVAAVSLYDFDGRLKKVRSSLQSAVSRAHPRVFGEEASKFTFSFVSHEDADVDAGAPANGHSGESKPSHCRVNLIGAIDGRGDIVRAVRAHCGAVRRGECSADAIDADALASRLRSTRDMVDPELAILFGPKNRILGGFLPWQSRVTEFSRVATHRGISYSRFFRSLAQFSNCSQRFGA